MPTFLPFHRSHHMTTTAIDANLNLNSGRIVRRVDNNPFEKLVQDLKDALGSSSGLTCDDVDVAYLTSLMTQYDSADKGWRKYFFGDASRGYTRNLVDDGNGKSNLVRSPFRSTLSNNQDRQLNESHETQLVLVWSPGKGSPIHDHGNAHCVMKILLGKLTETRYSFPDEDGEEKPMRVISERTHEENAVAYMADDLGVHRVWNNGSDFAVSVHCEHFPHLKA